MMAFFNFLAPPSLPASIILLITSAPYLICPLPIAPLARNDPSIISNITADTVVVPISIARPATISLRFGSITSFTTMCSCSLLYNTFTCQLFSLKTLGNLTIILYEILILSVPISAANALVNLSLSGIVSSIVGSFIVRSTILKSFVLSIPAAAILS